MFCKNCGIQCYDQEYYYITNGFCGECDDIICGNAEDQRKDMVNHPPHYTAHPSGVECIQITEHMNFCLGNAIKYIWRADLKNGTEDLKKAAWYIDREIKRRSL